MFDGGPVEFDNRTPHELRIYNMDKTEVVAVVPSSGMVRVSETLNVVSDYKDEVPLVEDKAPYRKPRNTRPPTTSPATQGLPSAQTNPG